MREVVVDAFLLHQPTDEVEVAFAVLHAVVARRIAAAQTLLQIAIADIAKYRLDDLRHAHASVDAAVAPARGEPGLRHEPERVDRIAHVFDVDEPALLGFADNPVEVARIALRRDE